MAAIRGTDTGPELLIRRGLHGRGFRYRLYSRRLPGKPDLVFAKYHAVIFVNGCFWHGHDCALFRWPATRPGFWREKIGANTARDARNIALLTGAGWRVAVVWECALKGRNRLPQEQLIDTLAQWLCSASARLDLEGRNAEAGG